MDSPRRRLLRAYAQLEEAFGPQHWWPADSPLEVMIGAVLVQNTSWRNVELAMNNLRQAGWLEVASLRAVEEEELAARIRPAGTYRVKARRLRNMLRWLDDNFSGDVTAMLATDASELRGKLLEVSGIGPETADSIVLYAAHQPTFVVDTYTYRVLVRHGWIESGADYDEIKHFLESSLPRDAHLYGEFHALLVQLGKSYCGKSPQCDECPLANLLPADGVPRDLS